MTRVTRFAAQDPGPSARVSGFLAHLRQNGLRIGVGETDTALGALAHVSAAKPEEARRALKAVCTGCKEEAERFDTLFDSYWMDAGRVRTKVVPNASSSQKASNDVHSSRDGTGSTSGSGDQIDRKSVV